MLAELAMWAKAEQVGGVLTVLRAERSHGHLLAHGTPGCALRERFTGLDPELLGSLHR